MTEAIDALEMTFASAQAESPLRSRIATTHGELFLMPATGSEGVGVKLVTVNPSNPTRGRPLLNALYVLFAGDTMEPVAVVDGNALTALRTAAVSGLATRHLAPAEASRLVIFGAGVQAGAHLEAMRSVRPVREVTIVSRTRERAERLANEAATMGLRARVGEPESVAKSDLICTCTTSREPLFDGTLVRPGTHINAVGAYTPDARELDDVTIRRARVVVETRAAALAEAGDLLIAIDHGALRPDGIAADLSEVVRGAPVRRDEEDITLFKSVGVAFEDLAVARAALDRLPA
jgi:ornithine cyclodeaminase/alanine dehydrogenase-like protein (mu-crystallin family)